MATFKHFEEMHAWQSARDLVRLVYDVTKQNDFSRDFALRDQIRRAAISIMSNISEGFDELYLKANIAERQINALIGYLSRSRKERTVKDESTPYIIELPDNLSD